MDPDKEKDFEFRGKPPEDAIRIASFASYDLLISGRKDCVYVYPTEYKVGTLRLSKQTIQKLIQSLE